MSYRWRLWRFVQCHVYLPIRRLWRSAFVGERQLDHEDWEFIRKVSDEVAKNRKWRY